MSAPAPLRLLGGLFRGIGKALDSVGAGLQGRLASPETGEGRGRGEEKKNALFTVFLAG